jgi:hypothetical protein
MLRAPGKACTRMRGGRDGWDARVVGLIGRGPPASQGYGMAWHGHGHGITPPSWTSSSHAAAAAAGHACVCVTYGVCVE